VLQNPQNALRSISRKLTKRAAIADRCRLQAIAEVACEFIADYVVPQMIIRSPRVQPGKLLLVDTKRLLQHYRPQSGRSPKHPRQLSAANSAGVTAAMAVGYTRTLHHDADNRDDHDDQRHRQRPPHSSNRVVR
jgi:hypothetical protein